MKTEREKEIRIIRKKLKQHDIRDEEKTFLRTLLKKLKASQYTEQNQKIEALSA